MSICQRPPDPPETMTLIVRDDSGLVVKYCSAKISVYTHYEGLVEITVTEFSEKFVDGMLPWDKD